MFKFESKLKYIGSISTCHALKSQIVLTPIRCLQNVWPDLGPNYLKGLSADDNVM